MLLLTKTIFIGIVLVGGLMPEAWMVRSGQRQRFIESLVKKFHDKVDQLTEAINASTSEEFESKVADLRRWFTRDLLVAMIISHGNLRELLGSNLSISDFLVQIQRDTREFARAPEEVSVLLHRFFMEVFKTLSNERESALSRLEFTDPQKIFHAPSAMTEVEIPHDSD
ncbi:MAG: hypothetical protein Q8P69_00695 [bacterium]|nr:hypothetical protein [bacterium]